MEGKAMEPVGSEARLQRIEKLKETLVDAKQPMALRFRVIFTLKAMKEKEALEALNSAFGDESALLKHEVAYVMGQMGDPYAVPYLIKVLDTVEEDSMVRHEAGEALGGIGGPEAIEALERHLQDPKPEVAETCQLAVDFIRWRMAKQ